MSCNFASHEVLDSDNRRLRIPCRLLGKHEKLDTAYQPDQRYSNPAEMGRRKNGSRVPCHSVNACMHALWRCRHVIFTRRRVRYLAICCLGLAPLDSADWKSCHAAAAQRSRRIHCEALKGHSSESNYLDMGKMQENIRILVSFEDGATCSAHTSPAG